MTTSEPAHLHLTHDDDFNPRVTLVADRPQHAASFADLAALTPDLPALAREDPACTLELARAFMHLAQTRQKLVESAEALAAAIEEWAEPPIEKLHRWYAGETISGPPAGSLQGPRWDGEALVLSVFNVDWGGAHRYMFGQTLRLTFAADGWSSEGETIDEQVQLPLNRTASRAEALFGGPVQGLFSASPPLKSERVCVAVGAGDGTAPYVWYPEGGEPQRFATYAELEEAHPEAGTPEFLAYLAGCVERYWGDRGIRQGNFEPIPDGPAYLAEYREQGWSTFKLRYWVDQIAEFSLRVPDLDQVASPRIEGDTLRAYFKGEKRQPFRLVVDLSALTLDQAPRIEPMATEEVVSDTGGLHSKMPTKPTDPPATTQTKQRRPDPRLP